MSTCTAPISRCPARMDPQPSVEFTNTDNSKFASERLDHAGSHYRTATHRSNNLSACHGSKLGLPDLVRLAVVTSARPIRPLGADRSSLIAALLLNMDHYMSL